MRTALLSLTLFFAVHTAIAAVPLPADATHATGKPPKNKGVYKEKKGTMGFVYSMVLGPFGYLGVHLFSHNEAMRHQAKNGLMAWTCVVTVLGVAYVAYATKNQFLIDLLQNIGSYN